MYVGTSMLKSGFMVFSLCILSFFVHADESVRNTKILSIITQDGTGGTTDVDKVWLVFDKNMAPSSCHTTALNRIALDMSKDVSKATLSLALIAYTTDRDVSFDTYGTCIDGVSEVRNFYFSYINI